MPELVAFATSTETSAPASRSLASQSPPPLLSSRLSAKTKSVGAASSVSGSGDPPPALPMTDEEALLAQRLMRHLAEHPRARQAAPQNAGSRMPAVADSAATGPEDVPAIEDVGPGPPLAVPVPLPPASGSDEDADAEATEEEAVASGPAPVWLASARRRSLSARLASALAWSTTLVIVAAVVGSAVVGLVGYQRSLVLAEGAFARIVDLGRAVGLIHV